MLASMLVLLAFNALAVSAQLGHSPSGSRRRHHHNRKPLTPSSTSSSSFSTASPVPHVGESFAAKNSTKSEYSIVDRSEGQGFFDAWDFFTNRDPTHGDVEYVSEDVARSARLAYVESGGIAVMKVDSTTNLNRGQNRKSVRISSKKRYDGGLFVLDVAQAPYGCSVWPAFWTVGQDWPNHGEIDIFEGVHNNDQNQATLHTSSGCKTDTSNTAPANFNVKTLLTGATVSSTNCASGHSDNTGCAFIDKSTSSYGQKLNAAGGAIFAMLWTDEGIRIWNFPRDNVPDDLTAQAPNPSTWDSSFLKAAWGASTCPTTQHFKQHAITFDITLNGDWAGATYKSAGCPGTAADFLMKGSNFNNAVWKVNSVSVYQ